MNHSHTEKLNQLLKRVEKPGRYIGGERPGESQRQVCLLFSGSLRNRYVLSGHADFI